MNSTLTVSLSEEKVQVLLDALISGNRFQWRTLRHCNAEYELHIILSGSCVLDVEGDVYPLSAGDAMVIAPNCFHSAQQVSGKFERLSLGLVADPGGYIAKLLDRLRALSTFRLTDKQMELCQSLFREADANGLFHTELCYAYLRALLILVFRKCNPEFTSAGNKQKRAEFQPRIVVDRFFSSWPVPVGSEQELAQLLHISRRQVVRFLKQNYGMSFREKYVRSRMDYAAWLLRSTDLTLEEIARQVNYSSESVFMSAFKKYFDVTPTEYRRTCILLRKDQIKET